MPDRQGQKLLQHAAQTMGLTARGYHRVIKVARTLADLDGSDSIRRLHIAEALSHRRAHKATAPLGQYPQHVKNQNTNPL